MTNKHVEVSYQTTRDLAAEAIRNDALEFHLREIIGAYNWPDGKLWHANLAIKILKAKCCLEKIPKREGNQS